MNKMEELVCQEISASNDPLLDKIEKTYNGSFPPEERRAFSLVRNLIDDNPRFTAYVILKDDCYVGFITTWKLDGFDYVEHFAIDPEARNGGIGATALKKYLIQTGNPVILEVECPEDEMSRRRVGFYERLGFCLDQHYYMQPPYREGDSPLQMYLMYYGNINLDKHFESVRDCIHKEVYGVKI